MRVGPVLWVLADGTTYGLRGDSLDASSLIQRKLSRAHSRLSETRRTIELVNDKELQVRPR